MVDLATANLVSEIVTTALTAGIFGALVVWCARDAKRTRARKAAAKREAERAKRQAEIKAAGLKMIAADTRRRTARENAPAKKSSRKIKICGYYAGNEAVIAAWE